MCANVITPRGKYQFAAQQTGLTQVNRRNDTVHDKK